jgi:hypothetical protein
MSSKIKKNLKKNISSKYNNFIKKLSKKNLNGKSLLNPLLYSILIVTLISIAYISSIIYYLNSLKLCKCFEEKNNNNYSNLTFLIIIEYIILIMNIILFLGSIYLFSILNNVPSGGAKNKNILFYIWFLVYLGIYGYFIYNVYKINQNIDLKCDCAKSWLRYLLYIQTVLLLINILLITAKVLK